MVLAEGHITGTIHVHVPIIMHESNVRVHVAIIEAVTSS